MGHIILTLDPQGYSRGPRGTPRGQGHTKIFSPSQQMLLIDDVTYASVMTKMCSASSPDSPGGTQRGPKGPRGVAPKVGPLNPSLKFCFDEAD